MANRVLVIPMIDRSNGDETVESGSYIPMSAVLFPAGKLDLSEASNAYIWFFGKQDASGETGTVLLYDNEAKSNITELSIPYDSDGAAGYTSTDILNGLPSSDTWLVMKIKTSAGGASGVNTIGAGLTIIW